MILNQSQAEAIYSAMCALNNVGARIAASIESGEKEVCEMHDGTVVIHADYGLTKEQHASQAAFAAAYGLNSDEFPSDVAAAAGGLTQTAIER